MSLLQDKFVECQEDYVGLWSIVWRIKRDTDDQSKIFSATMSLVSQLLEQKNIVSGQFNEGVFYTWNLPPSQVLEKIESEWKALGRDPNLGEIVWFTSLDFLKT